MKAIIYDRWIISAVLIALVLRLINLDYAALWHDEIETAIWSTLSWSQVLDTVLYRIPHGLYDPNHLPLYFLIVNGWTSLAGESPWLLRLPGVVFSVLTVALIAAIAATLQGKSAARWAALLAAISPFMLHHAQEARMYPLIGLLAAASLLLLVRFLTANTRRLGIGFVLLNLALLATHYYTVFLVCAELFLLLLLFPRPRSAWLPAALACAVGVITLVYIALFLTNQRSGEIYEIGLFALPGTIYAMLSGYVLLPSSEQLHAAGRQAIWPYLPYALMIVIPFAVVFLAGLKALSGKTLLIVFIILTAVILGPFAANLLFPRISINPRYFMTGMPLFLVILAAAAPDRPRAYVRSGALLLLMGTMLGASVLHLLEPDQKRENIYAAGRWLDANVPLDQEVFVSSNEMASIAYFHWPNRKFRLYPDNETVATQANAGALAEAFAAQLPLASRSERIFYLFGRSWLSDPDNALQQALLDRYPSCPGNETRGIRIYCFLPVAKQPTTAMSRSPD